ncbi:sensor histidine kinase [Streptococcus halichoeri]|uniref:sensor histidine kinase n=1 Tax=Streptococcus halichoeri TaxID=254785 RepID=UPI00135AF810|nr:HAMP domain-containing sensor histidine kinase [Streptococcus halichoeri]
MTKTKHLERSLRYYFVYLFIAILSTSSLLGFGLIFVLKNLLGFKASLVIWLLLYTVVLLVSGSLIMWFGSFHLTNPINQLNQAVQRVAQGDFSISIVRRSYPKDQAPYHNELDELSQNVTKMAKSLQNIAQLRQDFISNVSHELKTPIAALAGVSELLMDRSLPAKEQAELLGLMQKETERLTRLCDGMLSLSRLNKEPVPVDGVAIDEQIRQALILLTEKWSNKQIKLNIAAKPVRIRTVPDLTMQIWLNLLDNAIKYSDNSPELEITVHMVGGEAQVILKDHGQGIPQDHLDRVFEQFFQSDTSHAQEGSGLGLAIVAQIIKQLDGRIALTSQEQRGTTVTVTLPKRLNLAASASLPPKS